VAELQRHAVRRAAALLVLVISSAVAASRCSAASQAQAARQDKAVTVANLTAPGAFELRNPGAADVAVSRTVAVERQSGTKWEAVPTALMLIDKCEAQPTDGCVTIRPGAVLRPVPWNGFSCAPQCAASCRANVYLGPGTFRAVAQSCDRKQQFTGAAFDLPAQGKN
jgi:hypothetical protein